MLSRREAIPHRNRSRVIDSRPAGAAAALNVKWYGTAGPNVCYGHDHATPSTAAPVATELYGRLGPDTLFGQRGRDLLSGGSGADILNGGSGVDSLYGGSGADVILVQDGNLDLVVSGPGRDIAWVDLAADYWEGGGCKDGALASETRRVAGPAFW